MAPASKGALLNIHYYYYYNSLFVRDKYVTPTGKQLHAGYVQKAEERKKHTI